MADRHSNPLFVAPPFPAPPPLSQPSSQPLQFPPPGDPIPPIPLSYNTHPPPSTPALDLAYNAWTLPYTLLNNGVRHPRLAPPPARKVWTYATGSRGNRTKIATTGPPTEAPDQRRDRETKACRAALVAAVLAEIVYVENTAHERFSEMVDQMGNDDAGQRDTLVWWRDTVDWCYDTSALGEDRSRSSNHDDEDGGGAGGGGGSRVKREWGVEKFLNTAEVKAEAGWDGAEEDGEGVKNGEAKHKQSDRTARQDLIWGRRHEYRQNDKYIPFTGLEPEDDDNDNNNNNDDNANNAANIAASNTANHDDNDDDDQDSDDGTTDLPTDAQLTGFTIPTIKQRLEDLGVSAADAIELAGKKPKAMRKSDWLRVLTDIVQRRRQRRADKAAKAAAAPPKEPTPAPPRPQSQGPQGILPRVNLHATSSWGPGSIFPLSVLDRGNAVSHKHEIEWSRSRRYSAWDLYTVALHYSPYNPGYWVARAWHYFQREQFGLALHDAFRAQTLCETIVEVTVRNQRPGLYARVWAAVEHHVLRASREDFVAADEKSEGLPTHLLAHYLSRGSNPGVPFFIRDIRLALHHIIVMSLLRVEAMTDYARMEDWLTKRMGMDADERDLWKARQERFRPYSLLWNLHREGGHMDCELPWGIHEKFAGSLGMSDNEKSEREVLHDRTALGGLGKETYRKLDGMMEDAQRGNWLALDFQLNLRTEGISTGGLDILSPPPDGTDSTGKVLTAEELKEKVEARAERIRERERIRKAKEEEEHAAQKAQKLSFAAADTLPIWSLIFAQRPSFRGNRLPYLVQPMTEAHIRDPKGDAKIKSKDKKKEVLQTLLSKCVHCKNSISEDAQQYLRDDFANPSQQSTEGCGCLFRIPPAAFCPLDQTPDGHLAVNTIAGPMVFEGIEDDVEKQTDNQKDSPSKGPNVTLTEIAHSSEETLEAPEDSEAQEGSDKENEGAEQIKKANKFLSQVLGATKFQKEWEQKNQDREKQTKGDQNTGNKPPAAQKPDLRPLGLDGTNEMEFELLSGTKIMLHHPTLPPPASRIKTLQSHQNDDDASSVDSLAMDLDELESSGSELPVKPQRYRPQPSPPLDKEQWEDLSPHSREKLAHKNPWLGHTVITEQPTAAIAPPRLPAIKIGDRIVRVAADSSSELDQMEIDQTQADQGIKTPPLSSGLRGGASDPKHGKRKRITEEHEKDAPKPKRQRKETEKKKEQDGKKEAEKGSTKKDGAGGKRPGRPKKAKANEESDTGEQRDPNPPPGGPPKDPPPGNDPPKSLKGQEGGKGQEAGQTNDPENPPTAPVPALPQPCLSLAQDKYHYRSCNRDWKWLHDAMMTPAIDPEVGERRRDNESFRGESHSTLLALLFRDVVDQTLLYRRRHPATDGWGEMQMHTLDEMLVLDGKGPPNDDIRNNHVLNKGIDMLGLFRFHGHVRLPFQILECMGIDPFRELDFDGRSIQLVMWKLAKHMIHWLAANEQWSAVGRHRLDVEEGYHIGAPDVYVYSLFSMFKLTCVHLSNSVWTWDHQGLGRGGPAPDEQDIHHLTVAEQKANEEGQGNRPRDSVIPNRIVVFATREIEEGEEIKLWYIPLKGDPYVAEGRFRYRHIEKCEECQKMSADMIANNATRLRELYRYGKPPEVAEGREYLLPQKSGEGGDGGNGAGQGQQGLVLPSPAFSPLENSGDSQKPDKTKKAGGEQEVRGEKGDEGKKETRRGNEAEGPLTGDAATNPINLS